MKSGLNSIDSTLFGTVVSPGSIQNVPAPFGPVSVLILHGDQDPTVLYCGGQAYASQEQSFNYWSAANRCATTDTPPGRSSSHLEWMNRSGVSPEPGPSIQVAATASASAFCPFPHGRIAQRDGLWHDTVLTERRSTTIGVE